MSFRRFVNLVGNDYLTNTYKLRRIDMSRFFLPPATSGKTDPPPIVEACLPEPAMTFYPPERGSRYGFMEFMLVKDKVVSMDHMGNSMMYDPQVHGVSMLPRLTVPKKVPVSIAIGNALFVVDGIASGGTSSRSLEALVYASPNPREECEEGVWEWHALPTPPPPPFLLHDDEDPTCIDSSAVVDGSHIWFSTRGGGDDCTFALDTRTLIWSMTAADWALPFSGRAEYLPEHKLWFGISSRDRGLAFCSSDLAAPTAVPTTTNFKSMVAAPEDWHLVKAHALHLGCGKFCVARFFSVTKTLIHENNPLIRNDTEAEYFVVFAGVEVKRSNGHGAEVGVVDIVEHKSERYMLINEETHWVL